MFCTKKCDGHTCQFCSSPGTTSKREQQHQQKQQQQHQQHTLSLETTNQNQANNSAIIAGSSQHQEATAISTEASNNKSKEDNKVDNTKDEDSTANSNDNNDHSNNESNESGSNSNSSEDNNTNNCHTKEHNDNKEISDNKENSDNKDNSSDTNKETNTDNTDSTQDNSNKDSNTDNNKDSNNNNANLSTDTNNTNKINANAINQTGPALHYIQGTSFDGVALREGETVVTLEDEFSFFVLSNATHLSYNTLVAPYAHSCDGSMELLFAKRLNRAKMTKLLIGLEDADHLKVPGVEYHKVKALILEPGNTEIGHIMLDGEPIPVGTIKVESHCALARILRL